MGLLGPKESHFRPMALLDFLRRKFPNANLIAPRIDTPRPVPLTEAVPNNEWEGDYPLWNWDAASIQNAAIQHDLGNHVWSERLYEAMTREGHIYSALMRRGEGVRVFPFEFDYKDGTPERIQASGQALLGMWDESVLTEAERSDVVVRCLVFGFCACRVHKPLVNGQRVPKLEPWTHRTLVWDYSIKGWRGLDDKAKVVEIPREGNDEWVVFSLGGKRPWLKGAIRPLARVLYEILQTQDLWTVNNETLGIGQKILGFPYQVREQEEVSRAWAVARKLRSGDTWLKPKDWSLELLESKRGDTHLNFKERLTVLWDTVAIIILYHNLTQSTKGGSLAATKSAMDLPREAAVTDARILAIGYRAALGIWVGMNFAPIHYQELPRSLEYYAPIPEFDTEEPGDEKEEAETGQKNADALSKYVATMKAANVDVMTVGIDWRAAARRCNVPLLGLHDGVEQEADDIGMPEVKYLPAPAPQALPADGQREPGKVQKMAASGRESEAEGERLAEGLEQASPMWTA